MPAGVGAFGIHQTGAFIESREDFRSSSANGKTVPVGTAQSCVLQLAVEQQVPYGAARKNLASRTVSSCDGPLEQRRLADCHCSQNPGERSGNSPCRSADKS